MPDPQPSLPRPLPREECGEVFRFDADSYCVVFCREHSDVVQMTSNIAGAETAEMYADGIRKRGGHVIEVCSAGTLVAALKLIKKQEQS